jgi:glycosyltransferase involved in cell wall biosynthesis
MSGSVNALVMSERPAARRRLRVLTLIDLPTATGGAERLAVNVTARLDPGRFQRYLCVTRRPDGRPTLERDLEQSGVRVLRLNRASVADLQPWLRFAAFLRRERIDVIHSHKFGSNVWAALLGSLANVPVVVTHEHTWSFEGQPVRRVLDRELIARLSDVVLAVSVEDQRRMIALEGVPAERIRLVPNGIPPLATGGRDVRAELGIPGDAPVIGAVSVLRAQKALDVLVEAARVLVAEFPALRVIVAGDGPERERLGRLVVDYRLDKSVLLVGERSDVPDVLCALDVAVSSSDFEGSPLAVIEYMAAGLPVVATRVGGIPELIGDGVHGLLVPPRAARELAAAIATLLRDPTRRGEMGARARERQQREFSLDATVRRLEDLYECLYQQSERGCAERLRTR